MRGPRTATELMNALEISRRQTLLCTLSGLEAAGLVSTDIPQGERQDRQAISRVDFDRVSWHFEQIQRFALGDEAKPRVGGHK